MYKIVTAVSFSLLILMGGRVNGQASRQIIYVGTYSGRGSKGGIYEFKFNRSTGKMTRLRTIHDLKGPHFQALAPDGHYLYSVSHEAFSNNTNYGTIASYEINQGTGFLKLLNKRSVLGRGPAHVSVDPKGRFVYVSNFSSGNLSVFAIREDGSLSEAVDFIQHEGSSIDKRRQSGPHIHSIVPSADGRFIYVSDMGTDKINIYVVDQKTGRLSPAKMPFVKTKPGSGPRHFTIHPNNKFAYSLEQMGSTIAVFCVDSLTGGLTRIQRISTLPPGFRRDNQAADIHISPDGKFLYASNRGHNSLGIYEINNTTGHLSIVGFEPTRGRRPRNFMIDERGKFLLVANRKDDNIVVFRRDRLTGKLHYTGERTKVPEPVCLTQLFLN